MDCGFKRHFAAGKWSGAFADMIVPDHTGIAAFGAYGMDCIGNAIVVCKGRGDCEKRENCGECA